MVEYEAVSAEVAEVAVLDLHVEDAAHLHAVVAPVAKRDSLEADVRGVLRRDERLHRARKLVTSPGRVVLVTTFFGADVQKPGRAVQVPFARGVEGRERVLQVERHAFDKEHAVKPIGLRGGGARLAQVERRFGVRAESSRVKHERNRPRGRIDADRNRLVGPQVPPISQRLKTRRVRARPARHVAEIRLEHTSPVDDRAGAEESRVRVTGERKTLSVAGERADTELWPRGVESA